MGKVYQHAYFRGSFLVVETRGIERFDHNFCYLIKNMGHSGVGVAPTTQLPTFEFLRWDFISIMSAGASLHVAHAVGAGPNAQFVFGVFQSVHTTKPSTFLTHKTPSTAALDTYAFLISTYHLSAELVSSLVNNRLSYRKNLKSCGAPATQF